MEHDIIKQSTPNKRVIQTFFFDECDRKNVCNPKARFSILQNQPPFPNETQAEVVITCIIHIYIHRYNGKDEVQTLEEERLLNNIDVEDGSYYVPSTPIVQNLSRDELRQKKKRTFRDEIAQLMQEKR